MKSFRIFAFSVLLSASWGTLEVGESYSISSEAESPKNQTLERHAVLLLGLLGGGTALLIVTLTLPWFLKGTVEYGVYLNSTFPEWRRPFVNLFYNSTKGCFVTSSDPREDYRELLSAVFVGNNGPLQELLEPTGLISVHQLVEPFIGSQLSTLADFRKALLLHPSLSGALEERKNVSVKGFTAAFNRYIQCRMALPLVTGNESLEISINAEITRSLQKLTSKQGEYVQKTANDIVMLLYSPFWTAWRRAIDKIAMARPGELGAFSRKKTKLIEDLWGYLHTVMLHAIFAPRVTGYGSFSYASHAMYLEKNATYHDIMKELVTFLLNPKDGTKMIDSITPLLDIAKWPLMATFNDAYDFDGECVVKYGWREYFNTLIEAFEKLQIKPGTHELIPWTPRYPSSVGDRNVQLENYVFSEINRDIGLFREFLSSYLSELGARPIRASEAYRAKVVEWLNFLLNPDRLIYLTKSLVPDA